MYVVYNTNDINYSILINIIYYIIGGYNRLQHVACY